MRVSNLVHSRRGDASRAAGASSSGRAGAAVWPQLARHGRRPTVALLAVDSPTAASSTAGLAAESHLEAATLVAPEEHVAPASAASPFVELGVDPMLADALLESGVTRPSPIQSAALPAIMSGANCAVQSYTGSGKTLSYLLPVLTLALRRAEAMAADPATQRRSGVPDVPIQALVVAPSQELAMQIMRVAKSLLPPDVAKYAVQQVIGGANPKRQAEMLATVPGPLLVVGTPGRLAEMIRTGALKLHKCPLLVMDEADQLLSSAFVEDINHINDHCGKRRGPKPSAAPVLYPYPASSPSSPDAPATPDPASLLPFEGSSGRRQTVLVSATLTPSVLSRSARWCPDPRFVSAGAVPVVLPGSGLAAAMFGVPMPATTEGGVAVEAENPAWGWGVRGWDGPASPLAPKTRGSAGGVESGELVPTMPPALMHYYMVAEPRHKVDLLRRTVHALGAQRALVFMNFQQRLQDAQFKLQARGIKAGALHGELPRMARSNLLNSFRRGRLRVLMVSDVAARGLDVPRCDAVFNLELPSSAAHYAHRAGRTGRLSAALAAEAAAEAAAAAAAAAEVAAAEAAATGAAGSSGRAAAAAAAAAQAAVEEAMDLAQAAGTVVTVVAPNERFVVDKLSEALGVPLLEAHVSHGQFRLGPPPAGYSFDRDQESDRAAAAAGGAAGAEGGAAASGKDRDRVKGDKDGKRERRESGAEASSSGRAGGRDKTSAAAAAAATAAAAAAEKAAKKALKYPTTQQQDEADRAKYDVFVDDDDDILLGDEEDGDEGYGGGVEDYEIVEEDLAAFKRLRPSQVRQLAAAAAANGSAGAAAMGDAGITLKGRRKQRAAPPGTEEQRAEGAEQQVAKEDGDAAATTDRRSTSSSSSSSGRSSGGSSRSGGGRGGAAGSWRQGPQAAAAAAAAAPSPPRGSSRAEVMAELRRELGELKSEKEATREKGERGGRGAASGGGGGGGRGGGRGGGGGGRSGRGSGDGN